MNRGKAEAKTCAKADASDTTAGVALSKAERLSAPLAETRIEFARDYASHKDLSTSAMRFAGAVDSMRTELRGMNERLHRIIEKFSQRRDGGAIASA
jgi:signal transduction protein with GAF and PtsI domain